MKRFLLLLMCCWPGMTLCADLPAPRVIIAFYDKEHYPLVETDLHKLAEMPLNHLGLVLEYHDIAEQLPDIASRSDVRGIITWFGSDVTMKDPAAYLEWAQKAISAGKRFVIMENPGFDHDDKNVLTPSDIMDRFLIKLGVSSPDGWMEHTYRARLETLTPGIVSDLGGMDALPPYESMMLADRDARVHLAIHPLADSKAAAPLVITTAHGGIVAEGYASYHTGSPNGIFQRWIINPFVFFREAFATDDLPKPDTTTLAGRRIYYSHIDGDGWRNPAQFAENGKEAKLAARLVLEQAVRPYPDLPVTLTLIAGDVDPAWLGTQESIQLAKEFLAEPQVEAGSHTFSHPFCWSFFQDGNQEKERAYLSRYRTPVWAGGVNRGWWKQFPVIGDHAHKGSKPEADDDILPKGYTIPRAYAVQKFDLNKEIQGSADTIANLLPEGKKVRLLSWPGDTSPFEEAVRLTQEAGLANINGGDTRFDPEYPDAAAVAPIGRQVGGYWQIYSSMSNENTYTNLWTGRYHGYGYVRKTIANTESPLRLKPANLYYHLYAGEKEASFRALLAMLDYIRTQEVVPIPASEFSKIAQGFYSTRLISTGTNAWRVENRGALQTLRFDEASAKSVNFTRSQGVIGQRHSQGSLYVYLEGEVKSPIVALADGAVFSGPPAAATPYLVQSRWTVNQLKRNAGKLRFHAQGFGKGEMTWRMPSDGRYRIHMGEETLTAKTERGLLAFELPAAAINGVTITVEEE